MANQQHPPLGKAPTLPKKMRGKMMGCPYQRSEAEIPIIVYDIKDDGRCYFRYMDVQRRRLSRVVAIATLFYCGKPVTARRNRSNPAPLNEAGRVQPERKTGGVSYHIIRIINSLEPEDIGKVVDLLIDDQSHYCLGFRRRLNGVWGTWYRIRGNYAWPSFLQAVELSIDGGYSMQPEIGGRDTLNDILRSLWRYPDNTHDIDSLTRAFLRAVVVFCETLRLFSIWLEVRGRIQLNSDASALSARSWKRIRNWDSACEFVLDTAGKGHGEINEEMFWGRYESKLGYDTFDAIVEEIRVFKWQEDLDEMYKGQLNQWKKQNHPGREVANPQFDPHGPLDAPGQY